VSRSALGIFAWSRLGIWLLALFAVFTLVPARNPKAARWDDPSLTHDLGSITDVAALGRVLGGHYVLAGILVSLAATLGAFMLLERIAERHLGGSGARRAVLYLAVFPLSFFLQAVYSESLFLLLCLAAFVLAEKNRFAAAGLVTGLAILTRPAGIALVPPLMLIARRDSWRLLATALPVALAYPLLLWREIGDPWAFAHAEGTWHRHVSAAGPLGGIWDALRAGWAAVEQLASGSNAHVYWTAVSAADSAPLRTAALNLELLAFLVLFVVLTVIAWREFGAPYGLFAALSIALPLSTPSSRWPLLSLPRFGLVIFPLFLSLAWLGGRRANANTAILATSAALLGVFVTQWALWDWVA